MTAVRKKGATVEAAIDKLDTKALISLARNLTAAAGFLNDAKDLADALAAFEDESKASLRAAFGVSVKSLSV